MKHVKVVGGVALLVLGGVMLVTPGPGWLTIAAGLALLATEFVWAKRLLDELKRNAAKLKPRG